MFYLVGGCVVAFHLEAADAWVRRHARLVVTMTAVAALAAEGVYFLAHAGVTSALGSGSDPFQPSVIPFNIGAIACVYLAGTALVRAGRSRFTRAVVRSGADNAYGIYLTHMLFITVLLWLGWKNLDAVIPWPLLCLLTVVIVVACGALLTALLARTPLAMPLTGRRRVAWKKPGRPALTSGAVTLTRAEFVQRVERLAALFAARGVAEGSAVTICLPNSTGLVESLFAAWALGAVPQPVSHRLAPLERAAIVELANPSLVVGVPESEAAGRPVLESVPQQLLPGSFTPGVSPVWKLVTSGGSTGRPKLIAATGPAFFENVGGLGALLRMRPDGCVLVTGPVSHNAPFVITAAGMPLGNHLVVMPRFDPAETLRLVEKYRVTFLLGTELQAMTVITGTEWLAHRGSAGRPVIGEVQVRDVDGQPVPAGREGEIWMRRGAGAPPRTSTSARPPAALPTGGSRWATSPTRSSSCPGPSRTMT